VCTCSRRCFSFPIGACLSPVFSIHLPTVTLVFFKFVNHQSPMPSFIIQQFAPFLLWLLFTRRTCSLLFYSFVTSAYLSPVALPFVQFFSHSFLVHLSFSGLYPSTSNPSDLFQVFAANSEYLLTNVQRSLASLLVILQTHHVIVRKAPLFVSQVSPHLQESTWLYISHPQRPCKLQCPIRVEPRTRFTRAPPQPHTTAKTTSRPTD
jgi:hypothetical protein